MQVFEDLDDSDADKDYQPGSEDDDSDDETNTKPNGSAPEFRIIMEPPTERPDADTDCDSDKSIIKKGGMHYFYNSASKLQFPLSKIRMGEVCLIFKAPFYTSIFFDLK